MKPNPLLRLNDGTEDLRQTLITVSGVRWLGVLFGVLLTFAFDPISRSAALGVALIMAVYNGLSYQVTNDPRRSSRQLVTLAALLLLLDFACTSAWVYGLAREGSSTGYVTYALVGIEASVLFQLRGTGGFSLAFVAAYGTFAAVQNRLFGIPLEWNKLAYRTAAVLLLVLFTGFIVRQGERRRQQARQSQLAAERDRARVEALYEMSMRLGRNLKSADLFRSVVRELSRIYPDCWNAILVRSGEVLTIAESNPDRYHAVNLSPDVVRGLLAERGVDLGQLTLGRGYEDLTHGFGAVIRGSSGGVGMVVSASEKARHNDRDREFLLALAAQTGMYLDNAWLHETVEKLANIDPLTGIPNRRMFEERLGEEILRALRNKHPLSLVIMDLDHFKTFNDTHGHIFGDALLVAFAGLVNSSARVVDRFFRIGGEEFALILPETSVHGAVMVAERVREAVAQHKFSLGDAKGSWAKVTVSSGCSQLDPDAGDHARNLIRIADQYLYEAKRAGRDRVASPPLDETEAKFRVAEN